MSVDGMESVPFGMCLDSCLWICFSLVVLHAQRPPTCRSVQHCCENQQTKETIGQDSVAPQWFKQMNKQNLPNVHLECLKVPALFMNYYSI